MEVVTALCVSCLCVCVFVCVRDEGGGSQTTVCGPPHSLPNNPYYYVTVDSRFLRMQDFVSTIRT